MNRILVYGMTNNPGGIESYLMNEFSLLDREKAVFDFVVDFPQMCYEEKVRAMGSLIHFIPAKGKKLLSHWLSLYKILKQHPEYKKVYFNILDAGAVFSMLVPWLMGRKIIAHSHNGSTGNMKLHLLCKPFLKLIADKKIACSAVASQYMFDSADALIIHNAVDCASYKFNEEKRKEKRKELQISDDTSVMCFVGRLTHQKNVHFLIDVFGKVLEKNKDSLLLVVGDGEEKDKMISGAKNLGIYDNIRFMGRRNDVPAILCASDLFCMTSFYEGLSVVAVEAQASGLPCVFSDGMSEETKINSNVCFVPLDETADFWAEKTEEMKKLGRITDQTALQTAGYDLSAVNQAQTELLEYFYN